jgi:streptogramin lyase
MQPITRGLALVTTLTVSGASAVAIPVAARAASGCSGGGTTSITPVAGASTPFGVTAGPDGTWYCSGQDLVQVRPNGTSRSFSVAHPDVLILGALTRDGTDTWFTDSPGSRVGRPDPATGTFTMYAVPTAGSFPLGITSGPEGTLWFLERRAGQVARMTPAGVFTEWAVVFTAWALVPGAGPNRIVVGPDGTLWFTELRAHRIGRITIGPHGAQYAALFKAGGSNYLARFDLAGTVTRAGPVPGALVVGTLVAVWATDDFADTITRIRTQCGPPA